MSESKTLSDYKPTLNLSRFNNTFQELLTSLVNTCPIETEHLTTSSYLNESRLTENPSLYFDDFISINFKNISIFSSLSGAASDNVSDNNIDVELLNGVKLNDILSANSMQVFKNFNMLRKYLFTLFALAFSIEGIDEYIKEKFPDNKDILCESCNKSKLHIECFISAFKKDKKKLNEEESRSNKSSDESSNDKSNLNFESDEYENSEIVKLAKEISSELDPKDLEGLKNPQDIFSGLMGGNSNSGVQKIMQSVCSKLDNRIKSGNVNQGQLLKEAQEMMQKLNLFGGGMPDMASMASMAGMAGMGSKTSKTSNTSKTSKTVLKRKKNKNAKK